MAVAAAIFSGSALRKGLFIGSGCAWAASSLSAAALLVSKAHKAAVKMFWYAFGGGMALRFLVLVALMAYGTLHEPQVSEPALLMAYALGVLFFLLLEYRHIKLK